MLLYKSLIDIADFCNFEINLENSEHLNLILLLNFAFEKNQSESLRN